MKRVINWLTSNRILAVFVIAMQAWPWAILAVGTGIGWFWGIVGVSAIAIMGILTNRKWGRILGVALLAYVVANSAVRIAARGWTLQRVALAIGTTFIAWGLWRRPNEGFFDAVEDDSDNGDGSPPETLISLVLLRTTPRYLETVILAQALSDAWGVTLRAQTVGDSRESPDDDDTSDGFVAEAGPVYFVFVSRPSAAFFLVHNHDGNYFDEAESLAEKVPNLRFAEVIRNHQAWLSVDLLDKSSSPEMLAQAYRLIGKAVSALADDHTLALFCPQHSSFNLWSDTLDGQLCSSEPLKAFDEEVMAPIIGVKDDSGIEDAMAEARQRWPEFVEAFGRRSKEGPPFIVKAKFTTEDETEHMWLEVFGLEPEYVHGHLINDPFYNKELKKGSQVEVPVSEVSDWVFAENGRPVGNFTAQAVYRSSRSQDTEKGKAAENES